MSNMTTWCGRIPWSDPVPRVVVRIKGTNKAVAMTVDCNGASCLLHPYEDPLGCCRGGAQSGLFRR